MTILAQYDALNRMGLEQSLAVPITLFAGVAP
jgi:hypothetical protein